MSGGGGGPRVKGPGERMQPAKTSLMEFQARLGGGSGAGGVQGWSRKGLGQLATGQRGS